MNLSASRKISLKLPAANFTPDDGYCRGGKFCILRRAIKSLSLNEDYHAAVPPTKAHYPSVANVKFAGKGCA